MKLVSHVPTSLPVQGVLAASTPAACLIAVPSFVFSLREVLTDGASLLGVAVAVVLPEAAPPLAAASSTPARAMALPLPEGRREDHPSPPPETPREDVEDWRSVESASSQGDMRIGTIVETLASFGT
jgi:hypothetical protein